MRKKSFFKSEADMTQGNIWLLLVRFAAPLLLGYIFQQLYNTVDTYVVGNFVSNEAYAAVGNVGPITNMLIGIFLGLATGASVVLSQYYGAGDNENASATVHTMYVMTAIMSVFVSVVGILLVDPMLNFMKILDAGVHAEAKTYLTIYFAGAAGLMFYNVGAGVMRAVGDSTRPFIFLVITALLNTGLDLLFVLVFHMGVDGVAYATIISQFVSAVLVTAVLMRSKGCCRIEIRRLRIHRRILGQIVKVGLPSALQQGITSFSNVFVQSYINHFGPDVMAGWTTYSKLDSFALIPMMSVGMAVTTFVGQNLGAGNLERARKGTRSALLISVISTVMLIAPLMIWAGPLASIFNPKAEVVRYSVQIIYLQSPFYICCCINQIYAGSLRGAGATRAPMFIMLGSFVLFRQIYLAIMSQVCYTVTWVALGYPFGWIMASMLCMLYYKFGRWNKFAVTGGQG